MRFKVLSIILLCIVAHVNAQIKPENVVKVFGESLSSFCRTNEIIYREKIDELCSGSRKCRVEDKIHADYQKQHGLTNYETFVLDSYMNMFQSLMSKSVNYQMSNVKVVGSDEMPDGTLTFITADVKVSGALNHTVTDLFLVRNNKITGIYSYSSKLGFSHLYGSLIRALQIGRYQMGEFVNGYVWVGNEAGLFGLLDTKGNVIIPCMWHDMEFCGDFVLCNHYNPNRQVCYDIRNSQRTPFILCDVDASSTNNYITFFEGYASVLGKNDKWGFLSETDNDYSRVEYVYDEPGRFVDGYAYVTQNGTNKIINKQFECILQDNNQYEICGRFSEGLARIKDRETSKYGFIDKFGRIIIPCKYEYVYGGFSEGLCAIGIRITSNQQRTSQVMRYGYINKKGDLVIPPMYKYPESFKNGYVLVQKEDAYDKNKSWCSFINKDGQPLPGFNWEYEYLYEFQSGLARCKKDGKIGYLNMKGELAIPLIYTFALDFDASGLAVVRNDENMKYGCINTDGILVIPCVYDRISGFYNGVAMVEMNGHLGLIDMYGNSTFNKK